jgi:signal transduction histidine kinase
MLPVMIRLLVTAIILLCVFANASPLTLSDAGVKFNDSIQWHLSTIETDQIDIILKLANEHWNPSIDNNMSIGFVNDVYWAKTSVIVNQPSTWVLKSNITTLKQLDMWLVDEDKFISKVKDGKSDLEFFNLPDITRTVHFSKEGTYTLLFRIQQNGYLDFPAELRPITHIVNAETKTSYNLGLYYGFFCSVFIIAIIYFISTTDTSFLAFGFYILGFSLFFGYIDGILTWWLFPNIPNLNHWAMFLSLPTMDIGIAWFALKFFRIPPSLRWLKHILFVELIAGIVLFFIGWSIGIKATVYLSLVVAVLTIFSCILLGLLLAIRYKNQIAIPFILAWSTFGIYVLFVIGSILQIIPYSINDVVNALKILFAFQLILLFGTLAMRIRKIEAAAIQANAQNAAKTELLTRVSHEIRTPINGILGLTQLLEDHIHDEQGQEYQNLITESTESLLLLVNDIMDSRQIEEGRLLLAKKPIQLPKIFNSCIELQKSLITRKGLELERRISETTNIVFEGDEVRIRQILTNLIGNAIKFTKSGKISVTLDYDANAACFLISVSDTGIGISKENLEKILLPFEQMAHSKTEIYEGIGLGLFITKNLVNLMDGTLSIESELGIGSTFSVSLPAKPES